MRIGSDNSTSQVQNNSNDISKQQSPSTGKLAGLSVSKAQPGQESPVNALQGNSSRPATNQSGNVDRASSSSTAAQTGPTNLQVIGDASFRSSAAKDLATFAPGTTVDAKGFVHAAENKVAGHDTGYQLINNLLNSDKKVTIGFTENNAFTNSGDGAQGTPGRPNVGSTAQVSYDPSLQLELPTRQTKIDPSTGASKSVIGNEPINSAVVLAHELVHATHAQQGTIDRSQVTHTFTDGDQRLKETWRFEEFRTTGFTGARQGNEPTENSIRAELGYNPRATYLESNSWQPADSIAAKGAKATDNVSAWMPSKVNNRANV
jgi:hypothetical protein